MQQRYIELLKLKCNTENFAKLMALDNPNLNSFIIRYVELCNPASIFVCTDSLKDTQYIRAQAQQLAEEAPLAIDGHTVHFDGYFDQARDKEQTKFLLSKDSHLGPGINSIEIEQGLNEVHGFLKDIMQGKQMLILFRCLGPANSNFSIYAVQLTDSFYVAHAQDILYRPAYKIFRSKKSDIDFFRYVHSAGELGHNVSKNIDKRRIYIDIAKNIVYSVNTQYAGNTVGLKKLALRLAIKKADQEGWLAEHMFVMAVSGPKKRKTYFTGAFPSFCGKTSTCMVQGESILGDDIAYLRKRGDKIFAVNVERGIFGIIKDVNPKDARLIWDILTQPGEVIFSNVLVKDAALYWQGDGRPIPDEGINFSGKWFGGKVDQKGSPIPYAHANARYTIRLKGLKNCDPELDNPQGVEIEGIIYGSRDSDTWPVVFESFDWPHGVVTIAASLESETTAATLGKRGVRKFNPLANLDFLSIPIGKYIQNHLDIAQGLSKAPVIFGVNYFLKDQDDNYLSGMQDKRVWLKWMELRVHNDIEAIKGPIGFFPKYADLKRLFQELLDQEYTEDDYQRQFTLRVTENIEKIDRILEIYKTKVKDCPDLLFKILKAQKRRLEDAEPLAASKLSLREK